MFFQLASTFTEELAFQEGQINWATDWWKCIIIGFSVLLFLFLCVKLSLYILRIIGVILCVVFGTAGAWVSKLLLTEKIAEYLPESAVPYAPVLSSLLGFLVCFVVALGIMMLIRTPAQPMKKKSE